MMRPLRQNGLRSANVPQMTAVYIGHLGPTTGVRAGAGEVRRLSGFEAFIDGTRRAFRHIGLTHRTPSMVWGKRSFGMLRSLKGERETHIRVSRRTAGSVTRGV